MQPANPTTRRNFQVAAALVVLTWLVFLPVLQGGFLNYDDDRYVTENPHVLRGFSVDGIRWAFCSTECFNWHPVTWLSLMLDARLFGSNPAWFHAVNVTLHATSVVLLFLLLQRLTGALWRSAFVAAAFAVHPLHVESVAWIAERKDGLSGLFFMLTLFCYAGYGQFKVQGSMFKVGSSSINYQLSTLNYFAALFFFACGLMSKPMLVTTPFVLLLMDYWPLGRVQSSQFKVQGWVNLVVEKIPFAVLALLSSVVTYFAQAGSGAVGSLEGLPLTVRVLNALVAYGRYLERMACPTGLAVFYPYPAHWPWEMILAGAMVLVVGTGLALRFRRSHPYLIVGWLWFLGMLVPVIGLVQVGSQSLADRYMYLPSIGIFIIVAWGAKEWMRGTFQRLAFVAGGLAVLTWSGLAARQAGFWRDTPTLMFHTIAVAGESAVVDNDLGDYFLAHGDAKRGLDYVERALRLQPQMEEAQLNHARALLQLQQYPQVIEECRHLLARHDNSRARVNLGAALAVEGHMDEAIEQYHLALQASPDLAEAHFNLGNALYKTGDADGALREFQLAISVKPDMAAAHFNLGAVLLSRGRRDEAMTQFNEALRLDPDNAAIRQQVQSMQSSVR